MALNGVMDKFGWSAFCTKVIDETFFLRSFFRNISLDILPEIQPINASANVTLDSLLVYLLLIIFTVTYIGFLSVDYFFVLFIARQSQLRPIWALAMIGEWL